MLETNGDLAFWDKYQCTGCTQKMWTLWPVLLEITNEESHETQFIITQATRVNWQEGQENHERGEGERSQL